MVMKVDDSADDSVQAAVGRGVRLLDAMRPGWDREIDLDRLQMSAGTRCICGQLFGCHMDGLKRLSLDMAAGYWYGFARSNWGELEYAWRAVILERRARPQTPAVPDRELVPA